MSAEETECDLPPGQSLKAVINGLGVPLFWRVIDSRGIAIGALDSEHDAKSAAWEMFGIPRDEYKAMQRDSRAMELLRERMEFNMANDYPCDALTLDMRDGEEGGYWHVFNEGVEFVNADPAEAIILALEVKVPQGK